MSTTTLDTTQTSRPAPESERPEQLQQVKQVSQVKPGSGEKLAQARTILLDVVGPIVAHNGLKRLGMDDVQALMIAGSLPALGIGIDVVRGKRINGLSILVLGGIVLTIVLGLITSNPRMMVMEGALSSFAAGAFAVVTLFTRRTFAEMMFVGSAGGEDTLRGRQLAAALSHDGMRRLARRVNAVFAGVFFLSAAAQAALAWWAPVSLAFAYNRFGFIPCLLLIVVGAAVLFRRANRRGDFQGLDLAAFNRGEMPV